ncbi:hypothetical protein Vadar_024852 [Vaccinium darrowii]|uniref:Uncharacterized protein n=1 Tax=Vaccinium darrowii TaxID=229202 RepID=A0ACB7XTP8_9ERIC|nr:hypothetical protein Vadar_024852 [Vaccinium darrowii]
MVSCMLLFIILLYFIACAIAPTTAYESSSCTTTTTSPSPGTTFVNSSCTTVVISSNPINSPSSKPPSSKPPSWPINSPSSEPPSSKPPSSPINSPSSEPPSSKPPSWPNDDSRPIAKIPDVLINLRGTPGYIAPELGHSEITTKVDIYSFGIVLLEIVSRRKKFDETRSESSRHLLTLLHNKAREDKLLDIVDNLNQEMPENGEEMLRMIRSAAWCLQNDPTRRPLMSTVVKVLEGLMEVDPNISYEFTHAMGSASNAKGCASATIGSASNANGRASPTLQASVLSNPR